MNWIEINEKYPVAFLEYVQTIGINVERVESVRYIPYNDCYQCQVVDYKSNPLFSEVTTCYDIHLPHKTSILILLDYFDRRRIEIVPEPFERIVYPDGKEYAVSYYVNSIFKGYIMNKREINNFPDRISATAAGIEKAFEIREEQLNRIKNQ